MQAGEGRGSGEQQQEEEEEEEEDIQISQLPIEVLGHIMCAPYVFSLEDIRAVIAVCRSFRAAATCCADDIWKQLCFNAFERLKRRSRCSSIDPTDYPRIRSQIRIHVHSFSYGPKEIKVLEPASIACEGEDRDFGIGLNAYSFKVADVLYHNNDYTPCAFEKDARSLPKQLIVEDREGAEKKVTSLMASYNVVPRSTFLLGDVWWLPSRENETSTTLAQPVQTEIDPFSQNIPTWDTWREFYKANYDASVELDTLLVNLSKTPHFVPTKKQVAKLADKVINLLCEEPNVLPLSSPIIVIGDIHGQFHDLAQIFQRIEAEVKERKADGRLRKEDNPGYLFLGDYVSRGNYSIQVVCWLFALKVKYPESIHLLRGTHESIQLTQVYGFYDECQIVYGNLKVWRILCDAFMYLPMATLIDEKIFACHGGLSPCLPHLHQIQILDRFQDFPVDGPMSDTIGDVPEVHTGWQMSPRGSGFTWGADMSEQFIQENSLNLIIHGLTYLPEGYRMMHDGRVVMIFSPPCYTAFDNEGGLAIIDHNSNVDCIRYKFPRVPSIPRSGDNMPYFV